MKILKARSRDKRFITIGADPEFEVYGRNGTVVEAFTSVKDFDCGQIGRDGDSNCGAQVELRPNPGKDVVELIENIRGLLCAWVSNYPSNALGVAGNTFPLGGHIHFGFDNGWYYNKHPQVDDLYFFSLVLDFFFGRVLFNLNGGARINSGYGILADSDDAVRVQDWGFEYRVPPVSYYVHPEFCRIVLEAAYSLADKFWNHDGVDVPDNYNNRGVIATNIDFINGNIFNKEKAELFFDYISKYSRFETNNIVASWIEAEEIEKLRVNRIPSIRVNRIPSISDNIGTLQDFTDIGNNISIKFADNWSTLLRQAIVSSFRNSRWGRNRNEHVYVVLYGLSRERGDNLMSCSYNGELCNDIITGDIEACQHIYPGDRGVIYIGVDYRFRTMEYFTYDEDSTTSVIKAIKRCAEHASWHMGGFIINHQVRC